MSHAKLLEIKEHGLLDEKKATMHWQYADELQMQSGSICNLND